MKKQLSSIHYTSPQCQIVEMAGGGTHVLACSDLASQFTMDSLIDDEMDGEFFN